MLEDIPSNWITGLHFFSNVKNYVPTVPNLWDKEFLSDGDLNHVKVIKPDILLGYLVIFWTILYLTYEKCLNSLLRRMRLPLIQRSIIIESTWYCGFCVGSIVYLMSSAHTVPSFSFEAEKTMYEELGIILHKSFYFHRALVEISTYGVWSKGLANLLFASSIINSQNSISCTIVSALLFYKAIDSIIVNACRIFLCLSHIVGRELSKIIFWVHAFIWIYLYVIFVPKSILWPENLDDIRIDVGLWLWFITECVDSALSKLLSCAKATHWLEICLFPPPTQEAIQLANIQKKHQESMRKLSADKAVRKNQMWQTLMCVMAIKSKVKRMRQAKEIVTTPSSGPAENVEPQLESEIPNESLEDGEIMEPIETEENVGETDDYIPTPPLSQATPSIALLSS